MVQTISFLHQIEIRYLKKQVSIHQASSDHLLGVGDREGSYCASLCFRVFREP
jgi:hypothetical protein